MNSTKPRFICNHPGCGASYARKEHLVRHAAQHKQIREFICADCGLNFSRSDSLRRHARLHNTDSHSKQASEHVDRVARACDLCHVMKAKCDRQTPCAACTRKGHQCTFDRFRTGSKNGSETVTRSPSVASGYEREIESRKRKLVETDDHLTNLDFAATTAASSIKSVQPALLPKTLEEESAYHLRKTLRQHETQIQIDLMNEPDQQQQQLQQTPKASISLSELFECSKSFVVDHDATISAGDDTDLKAYMKSTDIQRYIDLFFEYVHPKWPILFRSSFRTASEPPIILLTVVMFGLWITEETRLMKLARMIHARLHVIFASQMNNWAVPATPKSNSTKPNRWPLVTYQAILLFTIFTITAHDSTEVFDGDDYDQDKKENVEFDEEEEEEEEEDDDDDDDLALDRVYFVFKHLVVTCRAQGVLHYPSMLTQVSIDDPIVFKFSSIEEIKNFALTLFKVDHLISLLMMKTPFAEKQEQIQINMDEKAKQEDTQQPAILDKLLISDLQFPLPNTGYMYEVSGIREFLRRSELQARDPSLASARHSAVIADDRQTMLDREKNPWICDILEVVNSGPRKGARLDKIGQRKRRKAWMSLGPWLGYFAGVDPVGTMPLS